MIYVSKNLDNDNDTLIELILHINILQCALQHFARDFGQTSHALTSLQFLKGNFTGSPNVLIFWRQGQNHSRIKEPGFRSSVQTQIICLKPQQKFKSNLINLLKIITLFSSFHL